MKKSPEVVGACFDELARARGGQASLDRHVLALQADLADPADIEYRARDLVDRMAVGLQAALLVQHAPAFVADAFCRSRLDSRGHHQFGALPTGVDCEAIVRRAVVA
jgi:putative acyl-CoA dehydrogenase